MYVYIYIYIYMDIYTYICIYIHTYNSCRSLLQTNHGAAYSFNHSKERVKERHRFNTSLVSFAKRDLTNKRSNSLSLSLTNLFLLDSIHSLFHLQIYFFLDFMYMKTTSDSPP